MNLSQQLADALTAHRQGKWDVARALYDQILAIHSDHPDGLHLRGALALAENDLATAEQCLPRAVELLPQQASFHNTLASLWKRQQKYDAAIAAYDRAIALQPEYADAYYNRGNAWAEQENRVAAIQSYEQAVQLQPTFVAAWQGLGLQHEAAGNFSAAERAFREVVRFQPREAEGWFRLGHALLQQGQFAAAIPPFERTLQIQPQFVSAWNNLSHLWQRLGNFPKSLWFAENAVKVDARSASAWVNRGVALDSLGKLTEAADSFRQALRRDPQSASAHTNLAVHRLRLGELPAAWEEFEWRWKTKQRVGHWRDFGVPVWQGESLAGKSLRIVAEQGMGDTLQFIRYGKLLREQGAKVVLECQSPLVKFLREQAKDCVDHVVPIGDPHDATDFVVPLMSLPLRLQTSLATIPADVPYLTHSTDLAAFWQKKLARLVGKKIGIAWQGNPAYEHDGRRSPPLKYFEPLAEVPNVHFISLQKRDGLDQLALLSPSFPLVVIEDLDERQGPFQDTAAIMAGLDLVITSDSAVAHLAGALGVPTWVPLPAIPDWRWMLEREDSPWYPTLRLFRQHQTGDWEEVFARIAAALEVFVAGDSNVAPFRAQAERSFSRKLQRPPREQLPQPTLAELEEQAFTAVAAGDAATAMKRFQQAVEHYPTVPPLWNNLGNVLKQVQDYPAAFAAFREAISLQPDLAEAHTNLGQLLLLHGDWKAGWEAYEWRLKTRGLQQSAVAVPWENFQGRTVLLTPEQGIGDEIMFASCVADLLPHAGRLFLAAEERLVALFARSFPAVTCFPLTMLRDPSERTRLGKIDFSLPTGSIPLTCRQKLADFPRHPGYLQAESSQLVHWQTRLASFGKRKKIGISWRGGANPLTIRQRSLPFQAWREILSAEECLFVNVQYGDVREVLAAARGWGIELHHFSEIDPLTNLDSFAALLANLDLVISVDNSTVHLAGGLGVPTWVALPAVPDWRWLLQRTDSPWYPSVRLFRQQSPGNWTSVLEELAAALRKFVVFPS